MVSDIYGIKEGFQLNFFVTDQALVDFASVLIESLVFDKGQLQHLINNVRSLIGLFQERKDCQELKRSIAKDELGSYLSP